MYRSPRAEHSGKCARLIHECQHSQRSKAILRRVVDATPNHPLQRTAATADCLPGVWQTPEAEICRREDYSGGISPGASARLVLPLGWPNGQNAWTAYFDSRSLT